MSTLLRAAAQMRRDAERVPDGRYGMESKWTTATTMLSRVTSKRHGVIAEMRGADGDGVGVYTASYFSRWHPAVALGVADWLDLAAAWVEEYPGSNPPWVMHAIAIARAYLKETP